MRYPIEVKYKADELKVEAGCYYDPSWPNQIREFCQTQCIQSKDRWRGRPLEILGWQWRDLIQPLYGVRSSTGELQHNLAICYAPKKVGKSTLLAALSLSHLMREPGNEVYVIASDKQQASIIFSQAADFCELYKAQCEQDDREPDGIATLWVRRNIKAIEDKKNQSVFRVLSSTPEGKSGFSANFIAWDEHAEHSGCHARTIFERLASAGMTRRNSTQVIISTPQYDRSHIAYEKYSLAKDIINGTNLDQKTVPIIYGVPEDADWRDENNWWPAVPSLDQTVTKKQYREKYQQCINSPSGEVEFRTFWLGQWVGHINAWLSQSQWSKCIAESVPLRKCDAYVGVDLSMRGDISSIIAVVNYRGTYYIDCRFFCSESNAKEKEISDHVPYRRWHSQGYINLTAGDVIDPQAILDTLAEIDKTYNVIEYRFDPYGAELLRQAAERDLGLPMVACAQHISVMAEPTAWLERLIIEGKIKHPNNPVLNWMVGNAVIRHTGDKYLVDKRRCTARVDGITATIIALSGWLAEQGDAMMPSLM